MRETVKVLNGDQTALVTDLTTTYNINPDDILFFEGDKNPFLMYEAMSVLCNNLANLAQIDIEPVNSPFIDSVSVKCVIVTAEGKERSHLGVANVKEQVKGELITDQGAINLASARALRNVLRAAGIDLLQLHHKSKGNSEVVDFRVNSPFQIMNRQAHKLGEQLFLIKGNDKKDWYLVLNARYGVDHSNELSAEQMSDFIAYLSSRVPASKLAA